MNKGFMYETDKQKWERLVENNIVLVSYIDDIISDISSNKTISTSHICLLLYFINNSLISNVNAVVTNDTSHLNYDFVEEAKNYGA